MVYCICEGFDIVGLLLLTEGSFSSVCFCYKVNVQTVLAYIGEEMCAEHDLFDCSAGDYTSEVAVGQVAKALVVPLLVQK